MALDESGTGSWFPTLPDQPPASTCVYGEVMACTGVPDDSEGVNGDIRINLANGDVYSKTGDAWHLISSGGVAGAGNLSGSGSPVGVVTPTAIYQLYRDIDTDTYHWATGLTNTDWQQMI